MLPARAAHAALLAASSAAAAPEAVEGAAEPPAAPLRVKARGFFISRGEVQSEEQREEQLRREEERQSAFMQPRRKAPTTQKGAMSGHADGASKPKLGNGLGSSGACKQSTLPFLPPHAAAARLVRKRGRSGSGAKEPQPCGSGFER